MQEWYQERGRPETCVRSPDPPLTRHREARSAPAKSGDTVHVHANHPLAGQDLTSDLERVGIA